MALALLFFAGLAFQPAAPAPSAAPPPARRARANLAAIMSDDDLTPTMRREHMRGRVAFDLEIDASGRVSACRITTSSGFPLLDARTCQILRVRATYRPARDAQGHAVPDTDSGNVVWSLPPD
jgi:periplasmic protein TonB